MTVNCLTCGTDFTPNRPWQTYCSTLCRATSPGKRSGTRKYQASRRAKIDAIKSEAGCSECGYNEHPAALQFHHVRGEKLFDVSSDPKKAWSKTLAEIEKCDVFCANCHLIHSRMEGHNRTKRKDFHATAV